jgi:hypothetical protein
VVVTQDRRSEDRLMLAEVYSWFTEGFETVDLKDAKAFTDDPELLAAERLANAMRNPLA